MNNNQFLISSYFADGALVAVIALAVYAYLRPPLSGITRSFRSRYLSRIIRGTFPVALVLPGLLGFVSVDYRACKPTYAAIIADRSYLLEKSSEQIGRSCVFLMAATLVWGIVVLIAFRTTSHDAAPGGSGLDEKT